MYFPVNLCITSRVPACSFSGGVDKIPRILFLYLLRQLRTFRGRGRACPTIRTFSPFQIFKKLREARPDGFLREGRSVRTGRIRSSFSAASLAPCFSPLRFWIIVRNVTDLETLSYPRVSLVCLLKRLGPPRSVR